MNASNSACDAFCWKRTGVCLLIIVLFYVGTLAYRVAVYYDGNVNGLFCISEEYTPPAPLANLDLHVYQNWIGYDGQFFLWLSVDPLLRDVSLTNAFHTAEHTSYRAQRIGLPLLAHALALGNPAALSHALIAVNLLALFAGCWFFLKILDHYRASPFWVFAYAFAPAMMAAQFRVLSEALASCLVVLAIWGLLKERWIWAAVALGAAVLVRETTVLFSLAVAAWAFLRREPSKGLAFVLPIPVYCLWSAYVYGRLGVWPYAGGVEPNLAFPFVGIIEKFQWVLGQMVEIHLGMGRSTPRIFFSVFVETIFCLGVLFAIYLAVKRLQAAPREWLTLTLCAYALLAMVLSALPWSRFWHSARILDPLVFLPLIVYLQTRDTKYLVPWACAAPVSVAILFTP